jgi:hypothetical protein
MRFHAELTGHRCGLFRRFVDGHNGIAEARELGQRRKTELSRGGATANDRKTRKRFSL